LGGKKGEQKKQGWGPKTKMEIRGKPKEEN
jgi:hypothetical protein